MMVHESIGGRTLQSTKLVKRQRSEARRQPPLQLYLLAAPTEQACQLPDTMAATPAKLETMVLPDIIAPVG